MDIEEILSYFKFSSLKIAIGENYDDIIKILGVPDGIFEQKTHKVKLIKYDNIELTFVQNQLISYSYHISKNNNCYTFDMLIRSNSNLIEKTSNCDFFIVSISSEFDLVFSKESNCLFKIIVK